MAQKKDWLLICLTSFIIYPVFSAESANRIEPTSLIQVKCDYRVGSNETLLNARQACFREARRRATEKAGVYLRSYTKLHYQAGKTFPILEEKIETFTAGFIKADILKEEIRLEHDQLIISLTVGARVRLDDLKKRFYEYTLSNEPVRKALIAKPQVIYEKTFRKKDQDKDGNIRAFTWNKEIKIGDIIEVISLAPKQSNIYIYRGKQFEPSWKLAQNGYHQGRIEHVPVGKSYYLWTESKDDFEIKVKITRRSGI